MDINEPHVIHKPEPLLKKENLDKKRSAETKIIKIQEDEFEDDDHVHDKCCGEEVSGAEEDDDFTGLFNAVGFNPKNTKKLNNYEQKPLIQ